MQKLVKLHTVASSPHLLGVIGHLLADSCASETIFRQERVAIAANAACMKLKNFVC